MHSKNIEYNPAIDHLRALAALLVLSFHAMSAVCKVEGWPHSDNALVSFIAQGGTGVSLFMMISGFLFTTICYKREFDYFTFLQNRALRIYPLYALALLFAFSASGTLKNLAYSLVGLGNTKDALWVDPFTGVLWSISVEIQFYIFFPFLLWFLQRCNARTIALVIAASLVARALYLDGNARDLVYYSMLGRIDQLLAGMIAAVVYIERRKMVERLSPALLCSSIGLVVLMHMENNGGIGESSVARLGLSFAQGALWASFLLGYLTLAKHIPGSKPIAHIGTVSYSLYVLHPVVVDFFIRESWYLKSFGAIPNALLTIIPVAVVSILIATISYRAVEAPFLKVRKRYLGSRQAVPGSLEGSL